MSFARQDKLKSCRKLHFSDFYTFGRTEKSCLIVIVGSVISSHIHVRMGGVSYASVAENRKRFRHITTVLGTAL